MFHGRRLQRYFSTPYHPLVDTMVPYNYIKERYNTPTVYMELKMCYKTYCLGQLLDPRFSKG